MQTHLESDLEIMQSAVTMVAYSASSKQQSGMPTSITETLEAYIKNIVYQEISQALHDVAATISSSVLAREQALSQMEGVEEMVARANMERDGGIKP